MTRSLFIRALIISLSALALSACAAGGVYGKIDAVKTTLSKERRAAIIRAEERRCRWPVNWIGDVARQRGELWLQGYIASCPELRALIMLSIRGGQ